MHRFGGWVLASLVALAAGRSSGGSAGPGLGGGTSISRAEVPGDDLAFDVRP